MTDATTGLSATAFGRRAAALLAASSEHLPRVVDLTVLGDRRELVLAGVEGPTLAGLLARRRLPAAEAVTVAISVARAVVALHEAGYCGVTLDDGAVRFDAAGTPLVLGLDALEEVVFAGAQGPADDWRAVAALADRLGLVAHGRAAGALGPAHVGLGLALASLTAGESTENVNRLEAALFELAEPEPVQLDGATPAAPQRLVAPLGERKHGAAHRRPSSSMLIEAFDAGPAALLAGPLAALRERMAGVTARLRGRARLLLVVGGLAVVMTVAAVALIPSGEAAGTGEHAGAPVAPTPSSSSGHATAAPSPSADRALTTQDPVAAVAVLLAQRDGCLKLSEAARQSCLGRLADGQASDLTRPARPLGGLAPSLLERTGDSALIALTPKDPKTAPASALLMRTEAGWRLRQLYEN